MKSLSMLAGLLFGEQVNCYLLWDISPALPDFGLGLSQLPQVDTSSFEDDGELLSASVAQV